MPVPEPGDTVYILESNQFVRNAVILSVDRNLYTILFPETGGAIRVPKHRIFLTEDDAAAHSRKPELPSEPEFCFSMPQFH